MKLPKGHQTVMTYLIIPNLESFIEFAKNVFEAREVARHLDDDKRIMHAEIMVGDTTIMMGESTKEWTPRPASLFIYVENVDATYQQAIKYNGKTLMEPEDKPYGRTCGVEDSFGNAWWITSSPA